MYLKLLIYVSSKQPNIWLIHKVFSAILLNNPYDNFSYMCLKTCGTVLNMKYTGKNDNKLHGLEFIS